MHVVIVGAGIMGCAVGWTLAREGVRVTLLEKAVPGAEASSAAAGILGAQCEADGPGPLLDLFLHSRALWPAFAADLFTATGIDVHLRLAGPATGVLEVFTDAESRAAGALRETWMRAAGLRAAVVDGPGACALEPALATAVFGGLHLPDDGRVDPRPLARAVALAAANAGAVFRNGMVLDAIDTQDGRVTGVRCGTEALAADAVVLAAGAWTDLLPASAPRRAAIHPVHGQLVLLAPRPGAPGERPLQRVLVWHGSEGQQGGYLVPRVDGTIIAGATTEQTGYQKQVTAGGLQHVLTVANRLMPGLRDAVVLEQWSGLRPRSTDGMPLLGPHPHLQGLHLAAGHYRNGILLAPVTARVVADAVLGRTQPFDLAPFRP